MRIGILGGTFDPVHKAHIEIAELAFSKLKLDKVIFVPNGVPPHKKQSSISNKDKLNMLKIAINAYKEFEIDTFELIKDDYSYLYLTLEYFKNKYPESELFFIAGSDNIENIPNWKNPELLFKFAKFVFVKRPEYELSYEGVRRLEDNYKAETVTIDFEGIDISSTDIRAAFEKCEPVSYMLPDGVMEYIVKNSVYPQSLLTKLRKMTGDKRYIHSVNVAKAAYKLANKYNEDADLAYYAGLLHDCAKKMETSAQLEIIKRNDAYPVKERELEFPKVIHALAGAYVARDEFGIVNKKILDSIRFHTLGDVEMSLFDKIIYIADLISDERNYKGVEILREMAYNSIDKAILISVDNTIGYVGYETIQPDIIKLRDFIKERVNGSIS